MILPAGASEPRGKSQRIAQDSHGCFLIAELELGECDGVFGFEPELAAGLGASENTTPLIERLLDGGCIAAEEQIGVPLLDGGAIGGFPWRERRRQLWLRPVCMVSNRCRCSRVDLARAEIGPERYLFIEI